MKFLATTAVALIAVTAPASAQYGSSYSGQPAQTAVPQQPQQSKQQTTAQQQAAPQQAAQNSGPQPSNKARKAIVDLQTAVNANDVANIPAKVAAAQAVAQTKDDRYAIGQLRLKAALAAKDNIAAASAVDAIAASGYLDSGKVSQLYSALGVELRPLRPIRQRFRPFQVVDRHALAVQRRPLIHARQEPRALRPSEREQLRELIVHVVRAPAPQRARRHRVRPRRAPEAEVDPPRYSASSVRNTSTTWSGAWLGIMMPPAPSRIRVVTVAAWAIRISGAEVAMLIMLWCSANQYRV